MHLLVVLGGSAHCLRIRYSVEEPHLTSSKFRLIGRPEWALDSSTLSEISLADDVVEEQLYTVSDTPIWLHVPTWVIKPNEILKLCLLDMCRMFNVPWWSWPAMVGACILLKFITPATD
jgi:hypothetical protein